MSKTEVNERTLQVGADVSNLSHANTPQWGPSKKQPPRVIQFLSSIKRLLTCRKKIQISSPKTGHSYLLCTKQSLTKGSTTDTCLN